MKRTPEDFLNDIIVAANDALSFVEDVSLDEFKGNKEKLYAVIRALEIIGEAARHIPPEIRNKHEDIPWPEMIGMRNIMIHEYFGVDETVIWRTVKQELPSLRETIAAILDELAKGKPH